MNNYVYISIDDTHDWIGIYPNDNNDQHVYSSIQYDEFKKLLMAQHKENELAYLLLKGVME